MLWLWIATSSLEVTDNGKGRSFCGRTRGQLLFFFSEREGSDRAQLSFNLDNDNESFFEGGGTLSQINPF